MSTSAACPRIRRSAISTTRCCRPSRAIARSSLRGSSFTSSRTRSSTSRTTRRSTSLSRCRSRRKGSPVGSLSEAKRRDPAEAARLAADFERGRRSRSDFRAMIVAARERLTDIYASNASDDEKRAAKAAVFADMRAENERRRAATDGTTSFDRWFDAGAEQRRHRCLGALRRPRAAVQGNSRRGGRRPSAVLLAGQDARRALAKRARRRARARCGALGARAG